MCLAWRLSCNSQRISSSNALPRAKETHTGSLNGRMLLGGCASYTHKHAGNSCCRDELQEQRAKDVVMLKRELSQFNGKFLKVEAAVRSVEEAVGFFYRNSNWDVKSKMKAEELMNFGKLNVETPGKYNESLARGVKAHLNSLGIGSPR